MKCPCCGGEMESTPEVTLDAGLTPLELAIMTAMVSAYPRGLTRRQLANIVYSDDPNGGPDTAEKAMSVYLYYIRAKIKPLGWHVGGRSGRGVRFLTMRRIDPATGMPERPIYEGRRPS